ncbi:Peptidase family M48 [Loktanella atrilutea]|uniref:Peptidase family M48 n=1 Tax=Loktanella atrilutea TaxID=366533 RepID=A0A1M4SZZ1_LOKAT|nr:M48 family metallopeptidase [Loktanella atrilutea]SHE37743.1 Peptidase family M48 [Loktanella atrilutea]
MQHLLPSLVVALGLAGCAGVPQPDAPRTEQVALPVPVVAPPTPRTAADVPPDARTAARTLVGVVDRVEPVAEALCRERSPNLNCDFSFAVDTNPLSPPNAFQTLDRDGRPIIAFTVALLAETRNPDELAFIMSHEAAHHIEGHLARQHRNADIGAAIMGQIVGLSGDPDAGRKAAEFGAAIGARTYSKDFELEADALGTAIAAQAGYDPLVGAEFFFRIPDPGNTFLGTHPANADRLRVVQRTVARLGFPS